MVTWLRNVTGYTEMALYLAREGDLGTCKRKLHGQVNPWPPHACPVGGMIIKKVLLAIRGQGDDSSIPSVKNTASTCIIPLVAGPRNADDVFV